LLAQLAASTTGKPRQKSHATIPMLETRAEFFPAIRTSGLRFVNDPKVEF